MRPMKDLFAIPFALAAFSAIQAQTTVTVSTAPGNVEQVWYSLQNGEVAAAAFNDWDLAFEMTGSYNLVWILSVAFGIASAIINLPIVEEPVKRQPAAAMSASGIPS